MGREDCPPPMKCDMIHAKQMPYIYSHKKHLEINNTTWYMKFLSRKIIKLTV